MSLLLNFFIVKRDDFVETFRCSSYFDSFKDTLFITIRSLSHPFDHFLVNSLQQETAVGNLQMSFTVFPNIAGFSYSVHEICPFRKNVNSTLYKAVHISYTMHSEINFGEIN